ncbi:hypothetical protein SAURM35S_04241 [Streptomyces aurantiogriseus]|nr:hypothetical protein [Streptomyces aurantiogriseus]
MVKEVDERVEQVFTEAFRDTAREFEGVFSRLFPGGEGRLILTDPVRAFKAAASRALNTVSDTLTARSALDRIAAEELVIAALALTGPLWQASHPAENVQRLYREEPELAHVAIDFEHSLTRLVTALGDGLIS